MRAKVWMVAGLLAFAGVAVRVMETRESRRSGAASLGVVRVGEMSVARAAHQAALLRTGQVLITGGCAGRGCDRVLASAELYDPARPVLAWARDALGPP